MLVVFQFFWILLVFWILRVLLFYSVDRNSIHSVTFPGLIVAEDELGKENKKKRHASYLDLLDRHR